MNTIKEVFVGKKTFDIFVLIEIAAVLAIMSAAKWIADSFQIIGPRSIAIWAGILIALFFMKRRGLNLFSLGLRLPKGRREWIFNLALALVGIIVVILFMVFILAR